MSNKLAELQKLTDSMNRSAARRNPDGKKVAFLVKGNEDQLDFGTLETGNPAVDGALGGGFPRGAVIELVGKPGAGKSMLCLDTIAHNQKKDPEFIALYVHTEAVSFPVAAAIQAGVDLSRLLVIHAQESGEKTFDIALRYLWDWDKRAPRNLIDLVVIDSVATAVPQAEIDTIEEQGLAKATIGLHARMMAKFLRITTGSGCLGKTLMILVNQVRKDVGAYGGGDTTTGGNATEHGAKIILWLRAPRGKFLKDGDVIRGHTVVVDVEKNNTGVGFPHRKVEYTVVYGQGVDVIAPLVDYAIQTGTIQNPVKGSFTWDESGGFGGKIRGRENLETLIRENPSFRAWIEDRIGGDRTRAAESAAPEGGSEWSDDAADDA